MATIVEDIKSTFRRGDLNVKLIYVNTAVFIVTAFVQIALTLFKLNADSVLDYFELPASVAILLRQPWSIITYMFMHASLLHLLFNMLWLFWIGHIFLDFFTARHMRGLYILGGLTGGLLYILTFNIFPYFRDAVGYSFLVGASASVLAIVAAAAWRQPNYPIQLMFIGQLRLKYVAIGIVVLDLLMATGDNAGGHIAHLGGAAGGLLFAYLLDRGTDLTGWINWTIDTVVKAFTYKPRPRKPKMKVRRGGQSQQASAQTQAGKTQAGKANEDAARQRQEKIDRILQKIKQSGYQSLTEDEKKELFNADRN